MANRQQYGDLASVTTHEAEEEWPTLIEVVAYYGSEGRKGRRKSFEIPADEFFGRTGGAPMSGDHLIALINRLRHLGPHK